MPPKPRAAAGHDINRISWRDWKRFELDEIKSRETGESWQVIGENLTEIDVLLEVMKNDGQIVWHGVAPLPVGKSPCGIIVFTIAHVHHSMYRL